jgi:TatD DNase family protein
MMLVDSHCHLDFADFHDDLDEVVARAREAGVGAMQTIGTRLGTFASVRAIAQRYDGVYCSVGVHPHNAAAEEPVAPAALVEAARHPEVIGIGETGLDYHYEHSPRAAQQQSFRAHIAAARETGLPLIVHTRDADDDTVAILKEEAGKGHFAGLVHCFSAGPGVAEAALELGLMISLSGIVTFRNADGLRAIVRALPRDRILVETDAPYLAPAPERGKRNEPAFVTHIAAAVADLLGIDAEALAGQTTRNFFTLFRKAALPAAVCARAVGR